MEEEMCKVADLTTQNRTVWAKVRIVSFLLGVIINCFIYRLYMNIQFASAKGHVETIEWKNVERD